MNHLKEIQKQILYVWTKGLKTIFKRLIITYSDVRGLAVNVLSCGANAGETSFNPANF